MVDFTRKVLFSLGCMRDSEFSSFLEPGDSQDAVRQIQRGLTRGRERNSICAGFSGRVDVGRGRCEGTHRLAVRLDLISNPSVFDADSTHVSEASRPRHCTKIFVGWLRRAHDRQTVVLPGGISWVKWTPPKSTSIGIPHPQNNII